MLVVLLIILFRDEDMVHLPIAQIRDYLTDLYSTQPSVDTPMCRQIFKAILQDDKQLSSKSN